MEPASALQRVQLISEANDRTDPSGPDKNTDRTQDLKTQSLGYPTSILFIQSYHRNLPFPSQRDGFCLTLVHFRTKQGHHSLISHFVHSDP